MKFLYILFYIPVLLVIAGCGDVVDKPEPQDPPRITDPKYEGPDIITQRELSPIEYAIERRKGEVQFRSACDTIALMEHIYYKYPEGTLLANYDMTYGYNMPSPAVIFTEVNDTTYLFSLLASSRPGERIIEAENIIGYDASFIDLDSTELGTAFIYLTLFRCVDGSLEEVWRSPVPRHGGFNDITMESWEKKNIPYVKVNFHYARGVGHFNFNYFLLDGLTEKPHMMMTSEGVDFIREIRDINGDRYPDYREQLFIETKYRLIDKGVKYFVWDKHDSLYRNTEKPVETTPY